jgi:hypothetical protein
MRQNIRPSFQGFAEKFFHRCKAASGFLAELKSEAVLFCVKRYLSIACPYPEPRFFRHLNC